MQTKVGKLGIFELIPLTCSQGTDEMGGDLLTGFLEWSSKCGIILIID